MYVVSIQLSKLTVHCCSDVIHQICAFHILRQTSHSQQDRRPFERSQRLTFVFFMSRSLSLLLLFLRKAWTIKVELQVRLFITQVGQPLTNNTSNKTTSWTSFSLHFFPLFSSVLCILSQNVCDLVSFPVRFQLTNLSQP